MEEVGTVKEIRGQRALVIVEKKGGCESCPGASLCNTIGSDQGGIEAINEIGAKQGDTVKIAFRSFTFLKGTIVVYLIPALFLVVGAVIGKNIISPLLPSKDPEAVSALAGFLLLILSFVLIKLVLNRFSKLPKNTPVITEIIE
ncbi:MAG: SoxR reducing system RseC family protein [Thermodesulfovibrionales bacterium]